MVHAYDGTIKREEDAISYAILNALDRFRVSQNIANHLIGSNLLRSSHLNKDSRNAKERD